VSSQPLLPAAQKWLYGEDEANLTQGARDFLEGKKNFLTSTDVDPEGVRRYQAYGKAMEAKEAGDMAKAEEMLFRLCSTPNIYKGHYRVLFQIWRAHNKLYLKSGQLSNLVDRVRLMVRFDDEMIQAMLTNWSDVWKRDLVPTYFDKSRNLKITDAKAFMTAARSLDDTDLINEALLVETRFSKV
jgi:hypothetical protein